MDLRQKRRGNKLSVVVIFLHVINVVLFRLIVSLLVDVHHPVGSLHAAIAISMLKHRCLVHFSNTNIVVIAPFALVVVLDERVVMATFSRAIMHTDCVQNVLVLLQVTKRLRYVILIFINLLLQVFHLFHHMPAVVHHCLLESWLDLNGLLEWAMRRDTLQCLCLLWLHLRQWQLILHFHEMGGRI
jgi:hypothetical protein